MKRKNLKSSLSPPPPAEVVKIARRQASAPTCKAPGCTRPAVIFSPSFGPLARDGYCSTTCLNTKKSTTL